MTTRIPNASSLESAKSNDVGKRDVDNDVGPRDVNERDTDALNVNGKNAANACDENVVSNEAPLAPFTSSHARAGTLSDSARAAIDSSDDETNDRALPNSTIEQSTDRGCGDGSERGKPPRSVEELQQLVKRIQAGASPTKLGPRTFRTLSRLVDSPRQSAVFTISELASALGVNASTLTRLSKRLGFSGFSEFQSVFRRHVAHGDDFYSERAGRFLADDRSENSGMSVLAKIAEDEQSNIVEMISGLNSEVLAQTASALASSRAVRVQGLRQYYPSACFLAYGLGMIREDASLLNIAGAGIAHSFAQLKQNDLLVAIGHAPYTRETVDACTLASHYKLRIIAITDSYASPLAAPAEAVLITPASGRFFGNSTAACVILVESLLAMTAAKLGQRAVDALKRHERVIDELGVAMDRN